jgi:hypothetical protein
MPSIAAITPPKHPHQVEGANSWTPVRGTEDGEHLSVVVGNRENLLPGVLGYEFGVVVTHVLLRLLYELVIRLRLDNFATGAVTCFHSRLLTNGSGLLRPQAASRW